MPTIADTLGLSTVGTDAGAAAGAAAATTLSPQVDRIVVNTQIIAATVVICGLIYVYAVLSRNGIIK
jgi:predicted secreted protein